MSAISGRGCDVMTGEQISVEQPDAAIEAKQASEWAARLALAILNAEELDCCIRCGQLFETGTVLLTQGSRFSHEVCPRLWEPVIEPSKPGFELCSGGQLAFPMLGVTEGGSGAR